MFSSSDSFATALHESWIPGMEVVRYGRTWRLTDRTAVEEGRWGGKLGFVKEGNISRLMWDPKNFDFRREAISSGIVVPFLIDTDRHLVSFQIKPADVRVVSVTGNLQALLNEGLLDRWRITPLYGQAGPDYDTWRKSVRTIKRFKASKLRKRNPHWGSEDKIKSLMDDYSAETVDIIARNNADGLNENSEWFQECKNHIDDDYGEGEFAGEDLKTGKSSIYRQEGSPYLIHRLRIRGEAEVDFQLLMDSQDTVDTEDDIANDDDETLA